MAQIKDWSLNTGKEVRGYKTGGTGASEVLPLQKKMGGGGGIKRFRPA